MQGLKETTYIETVAWGIGALWQQPPIISEVRAWPGATVVEILIHKAWHLSMVSKTPTTETWEKVTLIQNCLQLRAQVRVTNSIENSD